MAIPSPNLYFKFDEAGSTDDATEQVASKTLTRAGSIPAATGLLSGGRSFSNNAANYFYSTDSAFQGYTSASWQWSFWVKHTNLTESHKCVFGKGSGSAYEYIVWSNSADSKPRLNIYNATASLADSVAWGSALSTGTWYYISCGYDLAEDKIWISVNAGTKVKVTRTVTMTAGSAQFNLGHWFGGYPLNAVIDNLARWNQTLSDSDNTSLYNAGAGRTWDGSSWGDNQTYAVSATEVGSAADALSNLVIFPSVTGETLSATDSLAGLVTFIGASTESTSASTSDVSGFAYSAEATEVLGSAGITGIQIEVSPATDFYAASYLPICSVNEQAIPTDSSGCSNAWFVTLRESTTPSDRYDSSQTTAIEVAAAVLPTTVTRRV